MSAIIAGLCDFPFSSLTIALIQDVKDLDCRVQRSWSAQHPAVWKPLGKVANVAILLMIVDLCYDL